MGNDITEPTHFAPGKAGGPVLDFVGEIRGRLSDNFQGPLNCVSELPILQKIVQVVALGEVPSVGHRLVNIGEILYLTAAQSRKMSFGN